MAKRPGVYYRPQSLDEALRLLAQADVVPLAGGTRLLAGETGKALAGVVDLQDLGLNQIKWQREVTLPRLHLGAMTRLADLASFLDQPEAAAGPTWLLQTAIQRAGPNTYRNAATAGGIIASRLPDSELLAALLLLEATLTLRTPEETTMSLIDYLDAGERPPGLITDVTIPWTEGEGSSHRVARTPADTPIVAIMCWQPAGSAPRLAATGLGERPFRLTEAEAILAAGITDTTVEQAAAAAQAANRHPGDFRGDDAYRAKMAAVLTRRVLRVGE
ncbi:MAG TPA: FAD binding domain-containing protein [Anaerolineae bacterium]